MILGTFLDRAARTPFAWGGFDCGLWLADWLVTCGHLDPAAALRGTYADQAGAEAIIAAAGGLPALLGGFAAQLGLAQTGAPKRGDVGVVLGLTRDGLAPGGAICIGERWALLGQGEVIFVRPPVLAAWSV